MTTNLTCVCVCVCARARVRVCVCVVRNVFDWLVYSLLTVSFSVHMADVFRPSILLHTISLRLFSITVIFLWLRLMKHVRAFR